MEILVVGGTGHIGRFLVPRLIRQGFSVTVLTRGSTPFPTSDEWKRVRHVQLDYTRRTIPRELFPKVPEVVVDFPGCPGKLVDCFGGLVRHYVLCGSLWMYGTPSVVPTPERAFSPCRFEGYAYRFEEIQSLLRHFEGSDTAITAIMPPNIAGPGKIPLEGMGGRSLAVHRAHARGEEVVLPDGPEALIGPCDAEDIARLFLLAVLNPDKASQTIFNAGSAYALTATEFIHTLATLHGSSIPIRRISWENYRTVINPDPGAYTHFEIHMCPDISCARNLLGYEPMYTPEQALERGVEWMRQEGMLET